MGKKLSKAPVYYTVAQVQFNPVLDLDSYLPAIQSRMRDEHFSDYRPELSQRLVLHAGGEEGHTLLPTVAAQSRYLFGNIAERSNFILESNSFSYQTTEYDTFEAFMATFLKGLTIINDTLHLDFVERIGLRYLDAVFPMNTNETLRDYLVPEVLGLSGHAKETLRHSVSETISVTESSQLVTRVLIRNSRIGLPMELAQYAPTIDPYFTQEDRLHAIIDTDTYTTHRDAFDLTQIRNKLESLHEKITASFAATVTDNARAAWANIEEDIWK